MWRWLRDLWRGRPLGPDEPTPRQLRYARFIGVTVPKGCTRRELARRIDRALKG